MIRKWDNSPVDQPGGDGGKSGRWLQCGGWLRASSGRAVRLGRLGVAESMVVRTQAVFCPSSSARVPRVSRGREGGGPDKSRVLKSDFNS